MFMMDYAVITNTSGHVPNYIEHLHSAGGIYPIEKGVALVTQIGCIPFRLMYYCLSSHSSQLINDLHADLLICGESFALSPSCAHSGEQV